MSKPVFIALIVALVLGTAPKAHELNELQCGSGARSFAPADSSTRKYAPDRHVDILHLALDVAPDFQERSVAGTATLTFKPLPGGASELILNAEDLRVSDVRSTAEIAGYQNTGKELIINFKERLPGTLEHKLTVTYKAFPKRGLYFRTADMGYKPEDEHLFTQGEDIEARHWYPSYDAPNEKFSSEITCRVPEAMTVLSNGKLVSEEKFEGGRKAVRWFQEKPHVNYLISLLAGHFKKIEDNYRDIPLAFYTPSSEIAFAQNSFAETKEMMAFFEKEIGFPYPWDKYYQVCVHDFGWGGMENTSITTLNNNTLFPAETENIRSSQGLVAHELAHQWFGDLVTCEDWSQIWLNEGFATYYAHLYNRHKDGRDDFLYGLYGSARGFINRTATEDSRPIVFRNYENPTELFGYLVYPKAGWVLHMLRSQLGEDLYRNCIKTYLERNQFDTVETHDLITVVEELSGQSWDQFFDQWIFHPHHPELQVAYSWDVKTKLAKLTINQVQPLTNGIALFNFPLKVRFKGGFGTSDKSIDVKEKTESFYFPLAEAPKIVRLDPDYTLLARIHFVPPREMVLAQLKDEADVIGRIFALQELTKLKDKETIKEIADRLKSDPFYGVRIEAVQALRTINNRDALEALIAAADQPDARVRQQVAIQIGRFFDPAALDFALALLDREKNPDILARAISSLGAYAPSKVNGRLATYLERESFRNLLGDAAISALREQNNPASLDQLIQIADSRENAFTARGYGEALEAIAYLARDEKEKDPTYDLLLKQAAHKRLSIQLAALSALGTLQDERAIPVLARYAEGAKDLPETTRATRALESIRSARKVVNELGAIRTEMLDLKRENQQLKKTVEDLKKRIESGSPPAKAVKKRISR